MLIDLGRRGELALMVETEFGGELSDERTVRGNFSYWMTDRDLASRLAVVTVEVLRMESDDRRRKRRTRHVWDIN